MGDSFFQPISAKVLPRYAGIPTFMRLPHIELDDPRIADVDIGFAKANGIRIVRIEELFKRGVEDVMAEAREIVGDQPTYLTYDIDFVDATFAPGTGTPEIGGPNSFQAIEVLRELDGVDVIGADLVKV